MATRRKPLLSFALFAASSALLSCSSPTDVGDSLLLTANALLAHAPDGALQLVVTLTVFNGGESDVTVQPLRCSLGFIRVYAVDSAESVWSGGPSLDVACAGDATLPVPAGAYRSVVRRLFVERLREQGVEAAAHRVVFVPEFSYPRINTLEVEAGALDLGVQWPAPPPARVIGGR